MQEGLKLQAKDAEDIAVVSAILQDAIVATRDIAYQPEKQEFILVASRFRWEQAQAPKPAYERVNCAVTISGVTAVQKQSLDQADKAALHELLAVLLEEGQLQLVFAGGAQLRLTLQDWRLRLDDFGAPWPTDQCPRHQAAAGEGA